MIRENQTIFKCWGDDFWPHRLKRTWICIERHTRLSSHSHTCLQRERERERERSNPLNKRPFLFWNKIELATKIPSLALGSVIEWVNRLVGKSRCLWDVGSTYLHFLPIWTIKKRECSHSLSQRNMLEPSTSLSTTTKLSKQLSIAGIQTRNPSTLWGFESFKSLFE